jgi:hypothetical protein
MPLPPPAKPEPLDPFGDLVGPTLVHTVSPPNPAPPTPVPAPPTSDPFANFDAPPTPVPAKAPKAPLPAPVEDVPEESETPPAKTKRRAADSDERPARPRAATGGRSVLPLALLGGYALLATAIAVYGLFFRSAGAPDAAHPLSTIPDTFGEFDPVSRKKVGRLSVPADAELPPAQRAKLGDKLAVGQLEVKPVRVRSAAS